MLRRWAILTSDEAAALVAGSHLGADLVTRLRPTEKTTTTLVRPDGHVACTGDAGRIAKWLTGKLGVSVRRPAVA